MLQTCKVLACEFCSAKFHTQEMLNIHKRLHAKHSFMCVVCKAVFSTMASMAVHLWKAHAISKSDHQKNTVSLNWAADSFAPPKQIKHAACFRCYKCNKSFRHEFSIIRHLKTHKKQKLSTSTHPSCSNESSHLTPDNSADIITSPQNQNNPKNPNSLEQDDSISLNLSVDDQGPATNLSRVPFDQVPRSGKSRLSRPRFECGWCGASFRFDFSYEAHVRQHEMMNEENI